jgi:hypothetical protein
MVIDVAPNETPLEAYRRGWRMLDDGAGAVSEKRPASSDGREAATSEGRRRQ